MEARPLGGELDEHRHGAVRLRARLGEEPVGDLALHHHRPELDARQPVEALDDERRRDVVREIGDELPWCRLECREVDAKRVTEVKLDVVPPREPLGEVRLEGTVELDCVHTLDTLGEVAGQDAEAGADLEHDVVLLELREAPNHAEDVLVHQEVLAEISVRRDRKLHGSEKAAAAFAEMRSASSPASSPRAFASSATVRTMFAGSLGRPRRAWGAR